MKFIENKFLNKKEKDLSKIFLKKGYLIFDSEKFKNNELINSKKVDKYGIYLPNHANLTLRDIDFVSKVFQKVAKPFNF